MAGGNKMQWGDADVDDEYCVEIPPSTESKPDKNGVKTVTEYSRNENDKLVKTTRKIKVYKDTKKVHKLVAERRKWDKFGAAKSAGPGLEKGTTFVAEEMTVEFNTFGKEKKQEAEKDPLKELANKSIIICRHCGKTGDHWTLKCPYKHLTFDIKVGPGTDNAPPTSLEDEKLSGQAGGPNKYIAPGMRGGAGERGASMMDRRDDTATVRVTNLSEDTKESDLQDLFRPFGSISRIYLAKDRQTNQSKGFAFVNFHMRDDAQRAIDKLDGYGYDHLILKVEWARPSGDQ